MRISCKKWLTFNLPHFYHLLSICNFPHFFCRFWVIWMSRTFCFPINLPFPALFDRIWVIWLSLCNILQFLTGKQKTKKGREIFELFKLGFSEPNWFGEIWIFPYLLAFVEFHFPYFLTFFRIKVKKCGKFMIVNNIISYNLCALMALSSNYRGQTPFISICQSNEAPLKFLVLAIL